MMQGKGYDAKYVAEVPALSAKGLLTGSEVIAAGSEYEIDAKGTVTLAPGFKVEKGAYFSVTKSDY